MRERWRWIPVHLSIAKEQREGGGKGAFPAILVITMIHER